MATYKKNKKKMEEAILKLQQTKDIKQDESILRNTEQPRDKR
jgi:hypothetical protein